MMKVILAADSKQRYEPALNLLVRLRLPEMHVAATHVAETFHAFPVLARTSQVLRSLASIEEEATGHLSAALDHLSARQIKGEGKLLFGSVAKSLLEFAESSGANMIVAGSERKGRWGGLFMGSVTRAISISARTSFLVGKGETARDGPITAVFATDHSEYCEACAEKLLQWAPKGIRKLTIMTAHWTDISMLDMALRVSNLDADQLYDWISHRIESKNRELATRFEATGVPCEVRVLEGEPREAIATTMQETNADLLVLGARGHGIVDRITIGSVAMHEVVASPHSALVLRA